MKLKDIKLNFPISNDSCMIELVGVGEVIKHTFNSLYIKAEFIRSFNYTSDTLGRPCYKNPFKEARFEHYSSIIEIHSIKINQLYIIDEKVIFDTNFVDMDFDNVFVFIDVENIHIETFPPLQC